MSWVPERIFSGMLDLLLYCLMPLRNSSMSLTTVGVFTDTISFNVGFVWTTLKGADQSCQVLGVERNLEVMSSEA